MARDKVAGPESGPKAPFPIRVNGRITKGFGRGSKELGIPTANIPVSGLEVGGHSDVESGVYFGWAGLSLESAFSDASKAANPKMPQDNPEGSTQTTTTDRERPATESSAAPSGEVFPMVMSIGWNPFYKNEVRSVEVHIIHDFKDDFYNALMNLTILGFIRPEKDYASMQDLIDDI